MGNIEPKKAAPTKRDYIERNNDLDEILSSSEKADKTKPDVNSGKEILDESIILTREQPTQLKRNRATFSAQYEDEDMVLNDLVEERQNNLKKDKMMQLGIFDRTLNKIQEVVTKNATSLY